MTRLLASTALALTFGLGLSASAQDAPPMTDAERDAFRAEVRAYLLDNPEVIMEAVAVLEQRQQSAQAGADVALVADNADALFNDGYSWIGGNPDGDVTIVEFADYRCGYCKRAFGEVKQLLEGDGNIRLIIKEFPILGEGSTMAARFAIATQQIAGPDAYEAIHDALMVFNGDISETSLSRLAGAFGYDSDAIIAHMNSPEVDAVIEANHALARKMDISGTPSFVMGDQMLRGYVPLEGMQEIVAEVREQG